MHLQSTAHNRLGLGRGMDKERKGKTQTHTHSGQQFRFSAKAQIIYRILCWQLGLENVQGLYTLQSLEGFSPQFTVDASLGQSLPHARQEQEAVPHSANTAHCCLSFSAGLTSQKHPTRWCNCLPHWLTYCLTYMHQRSFALIPWAARLRGVSQRGFQFQQPCKWPQLRDTLLQPLNLTSQVGWENLSA